MPEGGAVSVGLAALVNSCLFTLTGNNLLVFLKYLEDVLSRNYF